MESLSKTIGQLARYGVSGIVINGVLYGVYLVLTAFGLAPWISATICFAIGIPISYATHRRYSFQNARNSNLRRILFTVAYIAAYFLQIGGLMALIRFGSIPHQVAQIIMTVIVALWLFLVQKLLVFRATTQGAGVNSPHS